MHYIVPSLAIVSEEAVVRYAAALAIQDKGKLSFSSAGAAVVSRYSYTKRQLLSFKKQPNTKALMGTLTSIWGFKNWLLMRVEGDWYMLCFNHEEDQKHVLDGTWFYGRNLFIVVSYDGLCEITQVPIQTFLVWIEILGLPPALTAIEVAEIKGAILGWWRTLIRSYIVKPSTIYVSVIRICVDKL